MSVYYVLWCPQSNVFGVYIQTRYILVSMYFPLPDRAKIAPSLIKPLVSEPASEKDQNIEMSPAGGDGGDGGEKPVQGAAASDGNCQKCGKGCKCKCKGARGGHYTARWVFYGLFIGVLPGIMLSILINICLPPRS